MAAMGLTPLAAVIALAIPHTGILAKIFAEMVDEAPRDAAKHLRDSGASPLQQYLFGLLPRARNDLVAYGYYRFECIVRGSAVLGFFGIETIGKYIKDAFDKNPDLDDQALRTIAHAVGIGAVKYADLSKNRSSDYIFNFEQMLSFEGNTAPYLLYAYTRVASVFRKAGLDMSQVSGDFLLQEDAEQALAARLVQFGEVLEGVAEKGLPHLLCTYLYDVAGLFSTFYEHCPILSGDNEALKQSRLKLAALTARTLKQGMELLGLSPLERM